MANKLKKNVDTYKTAEGVYLISKELGYFREKYELLLSDGRFFKKEDGSICLEFRLIDVFQFKSDALKHLEQREDDYIHSEKHQTSLLESGLITKEEFEKNLKRGDK
tara:strand:- start:402 stop:722 length:321 start_codon:yes stop_codon:yes gene_type:complete